MEILTLASLLQHQLKHHGFLQRLATFQDPPLTDKPWIPQPKLLPSASPAHSGTNYAPGVQAASHPSGGPWVPTWGTSLQGLLQDHYGSGSCR